MFLNIHTSKTLSINYVVSVVQFLFSFKPFFYWVNRGGANQRINEKKNQGLGFGFFLRLGVFGVLRVFLLVPPLPPFSSSAFTEKKIIRGLDNNCHCSNSS